MVQSRNPMDPALIFRLVHIDNLELLLRRGALHSPNHTPEDGGVYRTIHDACVQASRNVSEIPCGPGGTAHDYVPFYFGYLSVMLLKLKTGQVKGYDEGQDPLIYLVSSAQRVAGSRPFVFSDGHGLAGYTEWHDDLAHLDRVAWDIVFKQYWSDTTNAPDTQRRKQAEFLVYEYFPLDLLLGIAVIDHRMKARVEMILAARGLGDRFHVGVRRKFYYP